MGEFSYSRDHRKDREQLVIGLVTTPDGFPIKCNIYPGSTTDNTTVSDIIKEIKAYYPIEEFIFVGNKGMLSKKNIDAILKEKQQCIMAIPRAWTKKYLKDIDIDENQMLKIQKNLFIRFVPPIEGQRFLLCLNTEKRTDDTEFRNQSIKDISEKLDELNASLIKGQQKQLKTKEEAMKKVGGILKSKKAGKYFKVNTKDDLNCPLGLKQPNITNENHRN